MVKERHLHIYQRNKTRKDIYHCIHPDCTHYANRSFILGKRARCAICFQEYIITQSALRLKTPHCGCSKLTDQQRAKLAAIGESVESQQDMALQLLQAKLMKGI